MQSPRSLRVHAGALAGPQLPEHRLSYDWMHENELAFLREKNVPGDERVHRGSQPYLVEFGDRAGHQPVLR